MNGVSKVQEARSHSFGDHVPLADKRVFGTALQARRNEIDIGGLRAKRCEMGVLKVFGTTPFRSL